MFAVVRTGGKQYRVAPGDKIVVEKMDGDAGDTVTLGDILLAGDGSDLKKTDGLKVLAEIIAQAKGEKVTVFKKRRRHNYRRKQGHRQQHTILRITQIGDQKAPKQDNAKAATKSEQAPAKAKAADTAATSEKVETKAPPKAEAKTETKAEKPAAKTEKKAAPAKAKSESTKNAAPAKDAAKKTTKPKK
ncbi:50S ribosomal protein L21 [Sphingomonas sabuli]|uniref:Large ribosomal subunit protein bL21 n=1 Tax=Sphingomonas sabuli TaxID=2764186 RepID=A0A7G9L038_9SPHN|nr:50S ribosomal protein L21 [Sphingomonas sabuli]QNM81987.1 50S ribosomal protein L21 [Sphingomonas sabuli]